MARQGAAGQLKSPIGRSALQRRSEGTVNNLLFNPLGDGHLRSEADLSDFSSLPIEVDPLVFGQAMIEILGFEEAAREELAKPLAEISLDTFATSATASLAGKRDTLALSDRFYDLALNTLQRNYNQVKATLGQPPAQPAQSIRDVLVGIIKETGNWYSSSQLLTTAKYRRRIRWVAFASGFGLAAVLDLQPVPIGGSAIAGKLPYAVALFEWVVVAASTLFGAPFWFEILKKLAPGIVGPGNAPQPNAGL